MFRKKIIKTLCLQLLVPAIFLFPDKAAAAKEVLITEGIRLGAGGQNLISGVTHVLLSREDEAPHSISYLEKRTMGDMLFWCSKDQTAHLLKFVYSTKILNSGQFQASIKFTLSQPLAKKIIPESIIERGIISFWDHLIFMDELEVRLDVDPAKKTGGVTIMTTQQGESDTAYKSVNFQSFSDVGNTFLNIGLIGGIANNEEKDLNNCLNLIYFIDSTFKAHLRIVPENSGYQSTQHRLKMQLLNTDNKKLLVYQYGSEAGTEKLLKYPYVATLCKIIERFSSAASNYEHPSVAIGMFTSNAPMLIEIEEGRAFPFLSAVLGRDGVPEFLETAGFDLSEYPLNHAPVVIEPNVETTLMTDTESTEVDQPAVLSAEASLPSGESDLLRGWRTGRLVWNYAVYIFPFEVMTLETLGEILQRDDSVPIPLPADMDSNAPPDDFAGGGGSGGANNFHPNAPGISIPLVKPAENNTNSTDTMLMQ